MIKTTELTTTDWIGLSKELGKSFAQRATLHDEEGSFVFQNYEQLKKHKYFSAMIPKELGGGGISHEKMCAIIRIIAKHCASTALAFSMHQHLIGATIWKYKSKGLGAPLLEKVVKNQLVLISTGARDWLGSNGEMKKVEGGFLFTANKSFASQSIMGDIAITSAPFMNENGDWEVLHFPLPMDTKGVQVLDDWKVMGMRATGSHTIQCKDVFIPESAIALTRPRGDFHPVWNVVLTVAMPLIMSAYVGIAERAMEITLGNAKKSKKNQNHIATMIGKLNNSMLSAQCQLKAMYKLTNNFDFKPDEVVTMDILTFKTNVAAAAIQVVRESIELVGGQSYYKKNELERLFRDIQAAQFHPLPKWEQYAFVGERLIERY